MAMARLRPQSSVGGVGQLVLSNAAALAKSGSGRVFVQFQTVAGDRYATSVALTVP
jgi:hypothetical protein